MKKFEDYLAVYRQMQEHYPPVARDMFFDVGPSTPKSRKVAAAIEEPFATHPLVFCVVNAVDSHAQLRYLEVLLAWGESRGIGADDVISALVEAGALARRPALPLYTHPIYILSVDLYLAEKAALWPVHKMTHTADLIWNRVNDEYYSLGDRVLLMRALRAKTPEGAMEYARLLAESDASRMHRLRYYIEGRRGYAALTELITEEMKKRGEE